MLSLCKGCCLPTHCLAVWSALCGSGFLTSLFGFLPPVLPAGFDLWQSGANGTEPGFVSVVLWLDRCRLIGLLTSLSVCLSLPLDEVCDRVRWLVSESAVDQHPSSPTHSSSPFIPHSLSPCQRNQAGGGPDSPSDKATRPCLTFHPISSLILPWSFLTHTHIYTVSPHALSLCVSTEDHRQGALYVELC